MFNTLPLADSLLSLNLSRVTVSVTNKYIAENMWIVEESLSECGRMKIVFKQSCGKSKIFQQRTYTAYIQLPIRLYHFSHGTRQSTSGVTAVTQ